MEISTNCHRSLDSLRSQFSRFSRFTRPTGGILRLFASSSVRRFECSPVRRFECSNATTTIPFPSLATIEPVDRDVLIIEQYQTIISIGTPNIQSDKWPLADLLLFVPVAHWLELLVHEMGARNHRNSGLKFTQRVVVFWCALGPNSIIEPVESYCC